MICAPLRWRRHRGVEWATSENVNPEVEAKVRLLRKAQLFKSLRPELLALLAAHCRYKYADPGEVLIDEAWSSSPGLYVIVSGETRIERRDGSERVLLTMRKAGDSIGELSLLDGRPPSATVVAA